MSIKLSIRKLGAHYHIQFFASPKPAFTYVLLGHICCDHTEYITITEALKVGCKNSDTELIVEINSPS